MKTRETEKTETEKLEVGGGTCEEQQKVSDSLPFYYSPQHAACGKGAGIGGCCCEKEKQPQQSFNCHQRSACHLKRGNAEKACSHCPGGAKRTQRRGRQLTTEVQKELPGQEPWPGHFPAGCGFWGRWWGSQLSQPPRSVQSSSTGLREDGAARFVSQVRGGLARGQVSTGERTGFREKGHRQRV